MDILEDLRTTTFSNNEAFFKKAACEIEQLRTENAALKEQVAQWETEYNGCSSLLNNAERTLETLEETIAQQAEQIAGLVATNATLDAEWKKTTADKFAEMAEAIRLKDVLISEIAKQTPEKPDYWSSCGQCERNAGESEDALAIQPSPEILQARDERVAEACAEMIRNKELPFEIDAWIEATKRDVSSMTALALAALVGSGEWRKYL